MPTYEYECTSCKHAFEILQKMSERPLDKCPKCGGVVKRLIGTGSGIIFKGSGFYATDYRSQNYKKRQKEEEKTPVAPCEKKDSSKNCAHCPSYRQKNEK